MKMKVHSFKELLKIMDPLYVLINIAMLKARGTSTLFEMLLAFLHREILYSKYPPKVTFTE